MKKKRLRDKKHKMTMSNINLIRVPEREKRENGKQTFMKEITIDNFPKLIKDINVYIGLWYSYRYKKNKKKSRGTKCTLLHEVTTITTTKKRQNMWNNFQDTCDTKIFKTLDIRQ